MNQTYYLVLIFEVINKWINIATNEVMVGKDPYIQPQIIGLLFRYQ